MNSYQCVVVINNGHAIHIAFQHHFGDAADIGDGAGRYHRRSHHILHLAVHHIQDLP